MDNFQIAFPSPTYSSRGDEDRFFAYNLPEYVGVSGKVKTLTLELRKPVSRASFQDLIALFFRYGIGLSHLRPAMAALSEVDTTFA